MIDPVDIVPVARIVDEGQPVGAVRPGQHRRKRRDALGAGKQIGQLVDLLIGPVEQVDIADTGPVGDERDVVAVGGPLRTDVLPLVHPGQEVDAASRQIVGRDPHVADVQRLEVGLGAAIGGERDGLAVGRPDRVKVGVLVVGQATQVAAVGVDDEQVGEAAVVAGEDQLLAVGAPRSGW